MSFFFIAATGCASSLVTLRCISFLSQAVASRVSRLSSSASSTRRPHPHPRRRCRHRRRRRRHRRRRSTAK